MVSDVTIFSNQNHCQAGVLIQDMFKFWEYFLGIEKPPFELPEFIRKTGIMEMREALQQKESEQGMKAKMRQRVRPKLGKIDIDYQKLHDAFFRYQTKPKMSRHGDIYYEVSY